MLLYTRVQVLQVWQSTEVKRDILRWQWMLTYLRIDELSENVMQQILELCHRRRNCLGWLKDQSETIFWVNWNSLWAHLVESIDTDTIKIFIHNCIVYLVQNIFIFSKRDHWIYQCSGDDFKKTRPISIIKISTLAKTSEKSQENVWHIINGWRQLATN